MLPRAHRVVSGDDFSFAVRRGQRAGTDSLVAHVAAGGASPSALEPARIGFVVSRAVGGSVVRNRVKRRLRHLVASRLAVLPAGIVVVIRALPASAAMSSEQLAGDLDSALDRAIDRLGSPVRPSSAAS
ncbi:ribonuclease P protein component [Nocardioides limicola]|uniref:ribonuclease P protein component n=1 Tax=Nocardioides limicola TaxID=2803368 RepID=UPI00193C7348|nr:ribonuclease P protein component [Nocardioides sp. DJM-14]